MLDLAILGLLHEQELHGYEIRRRLRDELGLFANISFGSLYPALSRLEKAGGGDRHRVDGRPADRPPALDRLPERRAGRAPGPPGRSRPRHQAVAQGLPDHRPRRLLFEQLLDADEPAGTDDARSFGLRLAFARHLAPQARLALLERRRSQLTRRLAADRARAAGDRLDVYTRSLVEHSTEATEHDIAWLDRLIEFERQKQTAPRSESREPRDGDAVPATKGTNS